MNLKKHLVTFTRDPSNGDTRATCTCGWAAHGQRQDVIGLAGSHDLDELFKEADKPLPYASGLPEDNR